MSEYNPFSAAEESTVYAPEQGEQAAQEDGGNRKAVIALGALAGIVLAGGAFFFLSGGDETEDFEPVARSPRVAAPAASPAAVAAVTLPGKSTLQLGRNPFRALYVEPVAAAAPATGTTPTTPTDGTTTPVVTFPPPPVDSSGGNNPPPPVTQPGQPAPAPAPAPVSAQSTVALKSVAAGKDGANPTGTFVFDGKEVIGAPGDVMDGKLLVISLQQDHTGGWFANLQLGDGAPFEVHERQTVVVQ